VLHVLTSDSDIGPVRIVSAFQVDHWASILSTILYIAFQNISQNIYQPPEAAIEAFRLLVTATASAATGLAVASALGVCPSPRGTRGCRHAPRLRRGC
jgi:hypothetical protein